MQFSFAVFVASALVAAASVKAERHVIRFENKCGTGTPQLIQAGNVLSIGQDFVSNGPFRAGIAYLQTGNCGFNGDHCSMIEMTLVNPTAPGAGSSTDISLIPPLAFSVPVSFSYFNGCDRQGRICDHNGCDTAFYKPNDNQVQVQCQTNDVNLLITFCGDATKSTAFKRDSIVSEHVNATATATEIVDAASSITLKRRVDSVRRRRRSVNPVVPIAPIPTASSEPESPAAATATATSVPFVCRAGTACARHVRGAAAVTL
ncbi:hypothetical protein C8Q80DRAFT_849356 [Daedaleopsis nitida]|nr:hypothetical protein C8Q80DRAFT_849356 [Daedaleopsis nitida]